VLGFCVALGIECSGLRHTATSSRAVKGAGVNLAVLTQPAVRLVDVHSLAAPQFVGRFAWSDVVKVV
jgi:hypothetical protein